MKYEGCNECKCRDCANTACAVRNCKICSDICNYGGFATCNITIVCRRHVSITTNVAECTRNYNAIKGGRANYGK